MSDFSIYPDGIDGYAQLPLVIDNVTEINAVTVNRLRSAIVNIENELGTQPSGDFKTVRLRLDYLENLDNVIGYKNPARVASLSNISDLSSGAPNVVDGVTLADGDRVLVAGQTDKTENGIYIVSDVGTGSDGSWVRSSDADTESKLIPGSEIYIVEGSVSGSSKFWLITQGPITLGTTPLDFISGVKVMQSDATPTTVFSGSSMPTTETAITEIDVLNFKEIEWFITVNDKLTATQIDAKIQFSDLESPGANDWSYLQTEEISSGQATLSDYVAQKSLSDFAGGSVFRIGISSAVRGRTMRLTIFSDANTGGVTVTAIRRV